MRILGFISRVDEYTSVYIDPRLDKKEILYVITNIVKKELNNINGVVFIVKENGEYKIIESPDNRYEFNEEVFLQY